MSPFFPDFKVWRVPLPRCSSVCTAVWPVFIGFWSNLCVGTVDQCQGYWPPLTWGQCGGLLAPCPSINAGQYRPEDLTLGVLRAEWYGHKGGSIPWLLMPWLLALRSHQRPWYWLYAIMIMSEFQQPLAFWHQGMIWNMNIVFMFSQKNSAQQGSKLCQQTCQRTIHVQTGELLLMLLFGDSIYLWHLCRLMELFKGPLSPWYLTHWPLRNFKLVLGR